MVNYNQSIIYKLCCRDVDITEIYVGSTTNFYRRKSQHKRTCTNTDYRDYNKYVYQVIRENGGWGNWDMVIIEEYSAIDKNDLHKRERYWIETLQSKLNKIIPTRTKKEYNQLNKEYQKEYQKEYHQLNKVSKNEKQKEYNQLNSDKIIERQKRYRDKNRDEINKKSRDKTKQKRDATNERQRKNYANRLLKKQLKEPEQIQST